ncbi:MAG: glycosyltransferase family 39 protein [Candidatus Krumholzibacteria bacterium]|nr:glycosyltransferase family 39 protein [Candidatus Krumholzibacteria bacterium]
MKAILRTPMLLIAIFLVALAARIAALPGSGEANMTPDGARLLNLVRSIERGSGFVTPEAWPAWLNPVSLPTPETFKEPGYPYIIAALRPIVSDGFRAGQIISLVAGILLPLLTYAVMRAMEMEQRTAMVAGVFVAASPLLIQQSVYLMSDSLFAAMLMLAFWMALLAPGRGRNVHGYPTAFLSGIAFGLAFLVRAQAIFALPSIVWALISRRRRREAVTGVVLAALAAILIYSPYLVRNLRVFGAPFHSDVSAALPYLDNATLMHSLEHPPSSFVWTVEHPRAVAAHSLGGLRQLAVYVLPGHLLGQRMWLLPMALGLVIAIWDRRRWWFALLYGVIMLVTIMPVSWLPRYFTSLVPFVAGLAALGLLKIVSYIDLIGPRLRRSVLAFVLIACACLLVLQMDRARRGAPNTYTPELAAARAYGPWLNERLGPGEAVMAETTSYWSWYSDRPSVYLVICDEARFRKVVERLKVRWVALPLSRLGEFSERFPDGRLPGLLEPFVEDRDLDIAIFRVSSEGR